MLEGDEVFIYSINVELERCLREKASFFAGNRRTRREREHSVSTFGVMILHPADRQPQGRGPDGDKFGGGPPRTRCEERWVLNGNSLGALHKQHVYSTAIRGVGSMGPASAGRVMCSAIGGRGISTTQNTSTTSGSLSRQVTLTNSIGV